METKNKNKEKNEDFVFETTRENVREFRDDSVARAALKAEFTESLKGLRRHVESWLDAAGVDEERHCLLLPLVMRGDGMKRGLVCGEVTEDGLWGMIELVQAALDDLYGRCARLAEERGRRRVFDAWNAEKAKEYQAFLDESFADATEIELDDEVVGSDVEQNKK